MSKRKFGFEGFGINRQTTYNFEPAGAAQPLYLPSPPRISPHDHREDHDLDAIEYDEEDRAPQDTANSAKNSMGESEDEIDPLDAFMEGIHQEVKNATQKPNPPLSRPQVDDEDDEDPMETYLRSRKDSVLALAADVLHAGYDSDQEVYAAAKAVDAGLIEYDSDDNPVITADRKRIEPLPPLDHTSLEYAPFNRNFYEESASISGMSEEEVAAYHEELSIKVSGFDVSRPVKQFEDLGFDSALMAAISKQGYVNPTSIQCQALPVALSGRDMIGIAKTGSGKTAAFILPALVHIMDQEELGMGEGPICVICAPTRELAHQICVEAKKFAKAYGIRVSGVYGGMSKLDQFKELKVGCEIVVCTPGRLIDMIKMKALTMLRATYLVLDEADRMFDLGFEPQIRSIVGQIRPDRQTSLFSATMPSKVERLAREILLDPIRVTVGEIGRANEDITQLVHVITSDAEKMPWLLNKLPGMIDEGDVLLFASTKLKVEEIEGQLKEQGFRVAALHGDKDQASRMEILQKFKSGVYHVLAATDVAARGLDIKSIKSVLNFDIAKDIDSHVHRIGRTGRAGDKDGVAHTLITQKEARFAGELVNCLIAAGQNVPTELTDLAMKDSRFRGRREQRKVGRKGGGGGGGRGGGWGKGGGGGGGRGVRGVDYGLGLGYKADGGGESKGAPSMGRAEAPNRGTAVDALKVGMMARFKGSFVAASSSVGGISESNQYASAQNKPLSGFVSGGSIGGMRNMPTSAPIGAGGRGGGITGFVSGSAPSSFPNANTSANSLSELNKRRQDNRHNHEGGSGSDRPRERRRPSGWDR